MEHIHKLLNNHNLPSYTKQGILIVTTSQVNGLKFTKELLYRIVDQQTLLFLSGGSTPKSLYKEIAQEERLYPGTVGQVDERYGNPNHENSNQKMISDSGLLDYFDTKKIPFYPMLKKDIRINLAKKYDKTLHDLLNIYSKSIGLCGIGADGHTAGIAGNRKDFANPMFESTRKNDFVSEFNDVHGIFKERISLTFTGLSKLDLLIVLVFGDDKRTALDLMFEDGSVEIVPARFYKRPEIAKKTLLITDQTLDKGNG